MERKSSKNKNDKQIKIINLWVGRQFKGEYNPIHYHDGHLSGAGWLKVPKDLGKTIQEKKSPRS